MGFHKLPMDLHPTRIPAVVLIEPRIHTDARGFFMETFQARRFAEHGLPERFVQANHAGSKGNVLRGMHYQIQQAQGKLIQVVAGEVFDVAVDLRRNSPTFGDWVGERLSADKRQLLWIPPGFAHGYYMLSDWAEITYLTTQPYAPQWDRTLLWSDTTVGIEWPIPEGVTPILSEKDRSGTPLDQAETYDD